jgi:23S rRNA (uracil1939-C5)-methyltransferase
MEEKIVKIERVVFGGKGLSRDLDKVVFVPFTLTGEKVRIRLRKEHSDYAEADAVEILEPSKNRVVPECIYFGRCGGCQMSHATYKAQVELKIEMLQEAFQRTHLMFPELHVITSSPLGYRHRVQLKWDAKQKRLGFHEMESNHVVDVKECLCVTPGLNQLLKLLRSALLSYPVSGLSEIECFENDLGETSVHFNAPISPGLRKQLGRYTRLFDSNDQNISPLLFHFRHFEFPMRPSIFLQVNRGMIQQLVMELESHYDRAKERTAVELYCGSGLFTLPLAKRFRKIIACEENPIAIQFARSHNAPGNIAWICEKAERFHIPLEATVVIVDPPRAGLHRKIIETFLKRDFHKISYVSCDVSSFSRDLKALSAKYRIAKIALLDLFPQTYHFETVALLEPQRPKDDSTN